MSLKHYTQNLINNLKNISDIKEVCVSDIPCICLATLGLERENIYTHTHTPVSSGLKEAAAEGLQWFSSQSGINNKVRLDWQIKPNLTSSKYINRSVRETDRNIDTCRETNIAHLPYLISTPQVHGQIRTYPRIWIYIKIYKVLVWGEYRNESWWKMVSKQVVVSH